MSIVVYSPKNLYSYPAGLIVVTGTTGNTGKKPNVGGLLLNTLTLEARHPDQVHPHQNGNFVIFFKDVAPSLYALSVFDPTNLLAPPTACVFSVTGPVVKPRVRVPRPPQIASPTSGDDPLTSLTPGTGGSYSGPVDHVWVQYMDANGMLQTQDGTGIMNIGGLWSAILNFNNLPCTINGNAVDYTEFAHDTSNRKSAPDSGLTLDPSLCQQIKRKRK